MFNFKDFIFYFPYVGFMFKFICIVNIACDCYIINAVSCQTSVSVLCGNVLSCGDISVIVYIVSRRCRIHMCPAQDHFTFHTLLIISMTFVLPDPDIGLSVLVLYMMLSILLSIFVCATASVFCPGPKTITTQIKYRTQRARAYEVTSFLSTDCELSTETCSKNRRAQLPHMP